MEEEKIIPVTDEGSQKQNTRKRLRKNLNSSLNMLQRRSLSVETIDLTTKGIKHALEDDFSPSTSKSTGNQVKKLKSASESLTTMDDAKNMRRSQPHRAARFTESYEKDKILLSDEEKRQNGECSSSETSDSDCEIIPIPPPVPLSQEEQLKWEKKVQILQKELRDEEIKLLLLRKLKQSQMNKDEKETRNSPALSTSLNLTHKVAHRPPKTVSVMLSSDSPSKKLMPINRSYTIPKPKDLTIDVKPVNAVEKATNLILHNETLSKPSITIQPIPPPTSANNQKHSNSTLTNSVPNEMSVTLVNSTSQQEKAAKEMSAQHQAAAKLALRKQLEKTLLQIPPPKPPIPELRFLPNGISPEFICLLGLDIVVDFLTKMKPLSSLMKEPYSCAQCKTNFTTLWKFIEKGKSHRRKIVICQSCFSSNSKKSLKVEHTSRLKTAFVKALQQEKEIERLSHSFSITPTVASTPATFAPAVAHSTHAPPVYSKMTTSSAPSSSSLSSRTVSSSQSMFQANSLLMQQFSKLTPQQLQLILQAQAQSFMSANMPLPAHMVPMSPFLPQYPFHLLGKSSSSQSELQRQYLLDMIPPFAPNKRKT